jgi:hypothetical protein
MSLVSRSSVFPEAPPLPPGVVVDEVFLDTGDVARPFPFPERATAASRSLRFCEDSIFAIGATCVGVSLLVAVEDVVVVLP